MLFIAFFFFGLRQPEVVPGKLQSLTEIGIQFVRENIACPMLGPDSDRFMPLLATFFFAIFFWNIFEVVPGHQLLVEQPGRVPAGHGHGRVGHLQRGGDPQARRSSAT